MVLRAGSRCFQIYRSSTPTERRLDLVCGELRRNDRVSKLYLCHKANLESRRLNPRMSGVLSDPLLVKENFCRIRSGIESQQVLGSYGNLSHLLLESHNANTSCAPLGIVPSPEPSQRRQLYIKPPQRIYCWAVGQLGRKFRGIYPV
jgi:hypothetical protein